MSSPVSPHASPWSDLRGSDWSDEQLAVALCPDAPLDVAIARTVWILRSAGVETYESCEGGAGHCYEYPTVRFHGAQGAGWHALSVCKDYGLLVRSLSRVWDVDEGEPSGPYWQLVFRPLT